MPNFNYKSAYVVAYKHPTASDQTWYRIYSDGWIEQGGNTGSLADVSGQDITLPKQMAGTNYFVQVTNRYNSTTDNRISRGWIVDNTKIHVISYSSASGTSTTPCFWEVKGLVKNISPYLP